MKLYSKNQKNRRIYRYMPEYNYSALWENNITVRFFADFKNHGKNFIELPPENSEFYDISLGTYCPENCPFCYTSAKNSGIFYEDICETWKKWSKNWFRRKIGNIEVTNAPLQIAIGSGGSSDLHPQFIDFLRVVRETGVIPNYTTSGKILGYDGNDPEEIKKRNDMIDATEKYCEAVAISFGNKKLRDQALRAVNNLLGRDIKITIHHIISDIQSINEFFEIRKSYNPGEIHYHVLLPLVKHGRSNSEMKQEEFDYLEKSLLKLKESGENISDISFGAKFIPFIEKSNKLNINIFPEQTFSKNVLLEKDKVVITPSSFDLTPIKEIIL